MAQWGQTDRLGEGNPGQEGGAALTEAGNTLEGKKKVTVKRGRKDYPGYLHSPHTEHGLCETSL